MFFSFFTYVILIFLVFVICYCNSLPKKETKKSSAAPTFPKIATSSPLRLLNSVASHLKGAPVGQETALLAALMMGVDDGE